MLSRGHTFDFDIAAEIYPGVVLDGHITCRIDGDGAIDEHELSVKDKDGRWCDWDWDDLTPYLQDKIECQVISAHNRRDAA